MVNKAIKKRIEYLEDKVIFRKGPTPGLVYISGLPDSKTFEEAKAEYKQIHGFDLPENAPILNIVAYDGRRIDPTTAQNDL